MKKINDIIELLVIELNINIDNIKCSDKSLLYYNEILGDTSVILAKLLELLLPISFIEWDNRKWFDDCLISKIQLQNDKLRIYGIMIWGRYKMTNQWTEPFVFEIELKNEEVNGNDFIFLFSDLNFQEITYEEYRNNRSYWDDENRNWKYVIKSKEVFLKIVD